MLRKGKKYCNIIRKIKNENKKKKTFFKLLQNTNVR